MRRISRDPQKFDLMKILDDYARQGGRDIRDPSDHAMLLAELQKQLEENRTNDILIHGLRVQHMFAFVASALGRCQAIKEEDAGEFYTTNPTMTLPDFRIVTTDQNEFLVEVKNWHPTNPIKSYKFPQRYFDGLKAYAALFKTELVIALFWSPLKLWILVSPEDFEQHNEDYVLSFDRAFKCNKMSLLGDRMIGTVPSLTLKFLSDPAKPRSIDENGMAEFTIGDIEMYAGDNLISDDTEKNIAWFLMNYGTWPAQKLPEEIVGDQLISMSFRVRPQERSNPNQNFETIGFLSEMISRQFNDVTAPRGSVELLSPTEEPDIFGVVIPPGYRGQVLRLWRFEMTPNVARA
jgi:hypothetical protein